MCVCSRVHYCHSFARSAEREIGPTFRYQDTGKRSGNAAGNPGDGVVGPLKSFLFFLIHPHMRTHGISHQVATWPSVEQSSATFALLGAPTIPMEKPGAIPVSLPRAWPYRITATGLQG